MGIQHPTSTIAPTMDPAMTEYAETNLVILNGFTHVGSVGVRQEEVRILRTLIDQLPTCHRDVLLIVDVHGHTHTEAVQMLQLPLDTIKTHLCQARVTLRDLLVEAGQMPARPT